jgi:RNA polymerase sigma factor for flagellar operon FliA
MGCPDLPALDCASPGQAADRTTSTQDPCFAASCPEIPIDLLEFLPLVRSIASRIYASLPPYAAVELNDLMQSGHLGLVNAGRAYQSGRQVPFAVYARFRIRGEILDSLRHLDTATRRMRRLDKRIKSAKSDLRGALNRDPTDLEVTEKLHAQSDQPEIRNLDITLLRLPAIQITSLDDRDAGSDSWKAADPGPDSLRSESEARQLLGSAIQRLPYRSRELIRLYYQGGLTMREIGVKFNVNESRISQIHRRALERMALYLRNAGVQSAREI